MIYQTTTPRGIFVRCTPRSRISILPSKRVTAGRRAWLAEEEQFVTDRLTPYIVAGLGGKHLSPRVADAVGYWDLEVKRYTGTACDRCSESGGHGWWCDIRPRP